MNTFKLDQCERSVPSSFGVERINVVIFGLKNTTMIPYILFVAKNVSDEAEKNKIYGILESYVMRRMIVRASNKNYNNLFTSLIHNWPSCVTDDLERRRDSVLYTLGNLAIITRSLNASIRDAAWDAKKAGNGNGKPGLTLCASGLCTLYDVLTKTDWNDDEISTRAKWLFEQARMIWSL